MSANDPTTAYAGSDSGYDAFLTKAEGNRDRRNWVNNITVAISAGVTAYDLADDDDLVIISSDGTNGDINLPDDLSGMLGRVVRFKTLALNTATITLVPGGASKIDGSASSQTMTADNQYVEMFVGKSAEWVIGADTR